MKKSFKELAKQINQLTETQEGELRGGFASAFQLTTIESAPLGNNCSCTNIDSSCGATGNNCKCKSTDTITSL
ncbi:hypothetical protein [Flavobacterium sp. U410]|jgi:hypothetical protein